MGETRAREALSGLDLAAIVRELSGAIEGSRLANIYQLDKNKFLLKLRKPGTTYKLLIDLAGRAHLFPGEFKAPERPTGFCMGLRKDLRGGKLLGVGQHDLDRILALVVEKAGERQELIFELFGGGNVVLVAPDGTIKRVLRPREMRDRALVVGELYRPPPRPSIELEKADASALRALRDMGSIEAVRGLSRATGLGGPYPEEVLLRAGVEKAKPCSSLTDEELELIARALSELLQEVLRGPLKPGVVIGQDGRPIDVVPIEMRRYSGLEKLSFNTFNEAVYAYFTRLDELKIAEERSKEVEEEIRKIEEIIKIQEEALRRFKMEEERLTAIGNTIFSYLNQLNMLLAELRHLRDELGSWRAVVKRVEMLKTRGAPFSWIIHALEDRPSIIVKLDGLEVELDVRKKAQDIASSYYERAKKIRKKARGAARALEEMRKTLEEAKARLKDVERPRKRPMEEREAVGKLGRKAWYEQFRWFRSSDGFLIVAGKDAVTNERLVRRYAEPGDLLLHTELPGAPFVLVKAGGREISEQALHEAAEVAASYSRAWKYGLGAATVLCFSPSQVRKIGPHGEKLPRGAFYISGPKKYIRGVKLNLAIGLLKMGNDRYKLVIGPVKAISSRTDVYVIIKPGDMKADELLKGVLEFFKRRKGDIEVSRADVEHAKALIPYGRGAITISPS